MGITLFSAVLSYLLLIPALYIAWKCELYITRKALLAVARMSIQLYLMGLYLGWIFQIDSPYINIAWLLVMLLVANISILKQRDLSFKVLFVPSLLANVIVFFAILAFFMLFVVRGYQNGNMLSARFLIPLAGMILGNTIRGNALALEHFYVELKERPQEYTMRLLLGATPAEAARPYFYSAMRLTVMPNLSFISSAGVVSMPGMMTGQLLGGAMPMEAIYYQLAIMIGIFTGMIMAAAASLYFSQSHAFDEYGILKENVVPPLKKHD